MSKVLGIDYGEKRIGFAVSDEDRKLAFPRTVLQNIDKYIFEYINKMITEDGVTEIVLGLPLSLKGEETEISRKVMRFKKGIEEKFKIPIHFESEVYTSKMARDSGATSAERVDSSSAALILQTWLDRVGE